MKPMVTIRHLLMWLSMCSADKSSAKGEQLPYIGLTFANITCQIGFFLAGSAFAKKYLSINVIVALFALIHVIGISSMIYTFTVIYSTRHKIDTIFEKMSMIYEESKNFI